MELPKRKQNRLTGYDYSTPNAYFITICTDNRRNLFWKGVEVIIDRPENVPLTDLGRIVQQSIEDISKHYPMISVDHYVIMPNHVHLLLQINTDPDGRSMIAPTCARGNDSQHNSGSRDRTLAFLIANKYNSVR